MTTHRTLVLLCCLMPFAPAQAAECSNVTSEHITGRDLSVAFPALNAIPAELIIGYAPLPGTKRIFHPAEILSIARRNNISLQTAPDICFEWPMRPLDRDAVLKAMQLSIQTPGVRIELTEISAFPVPYGQLEFPRGHLGKPALPDQASPVLWRGSVLYAKNRRYPVWAKVRITTACVKLVAIESLKPGNQITAAQVKEETGTCFPDLSQRLLTRLEAVGKIPLRIIPAGSEIRPGVLTEPYAVNQGDEIAIEVRSGSARLAFTARAQASGRAGDLISVRNPESKRVFRARVEGKDKAVVEAGN
jgi:flagella basal body P-ring formation protein FlgA